MARLSISHLKKTYGALTVVDDVDIAVADGEFLVLLGPSGCGKTTTLRMIAGFVPQSAGRITIYDREGFQADSYAAILLGHGIRPERTDPLIDRMDQARLLDHFRKVHATIRQVVGAMPGHAALVAQITGEPIRKS